MKTKVIIIALSGVAIIMLLVWFMQIGKNGKMRAGDTDVSSEGSHPLNASGIMGVRRPPDDAIPLMEADVAILAAAVSQYYKIVHALPTGDNASISAALYGNNPAGAVILEKSNRWKNGRFVDGRAMPYDIRIETNYLTLRSAGLNKIMGDSDDIVETREVKVSNAP